MKIRSPYIAARRCRDNDAARDANARECLRKAEGGMSSVFQRE
jgi:hypothetical protein